MIRAWEGLGYNRRAVRLQHIARHVVEQRGGHLPRELADLVRLEGVGSYTAAAVACFAFGIPMPVLDTNIRRVLSRVLFGLRSVSLKDLCRGAQSLVEALPAGKASSWSQALMDLGATVCIQRLPRCSICPVRQDRVAAPLIQHAR